MALPDGDAHVCQRCGLTPRDLGGRLDPSRGIATLQLLVEERACCDAIRLFGAKGQIREVEVVPAEVPHVGVVVTRLHFISTRFDHNPREEKTNKSMYCDTSASTAF